MTKHSFSLDLKATLNELEGAADCLRAGNKEGAEELTRKALARLLSHGEGEAMIVTCRRRSYGDLMQF